MNHSGLQRLDDLEPEFKLRIKELLAELDPVCVVSSRRTIQQQNQLYSQGRTTGGYVVTNAKGGESPHNFGLAVDLCPLDQNGNLDWYDKVGFRKIGAAAESLGLVWGGKFKSIVDKPHVESPDWRVTQAAWRKGEVEIA